MPATTRSEACSHLPAHVAIILDGNGRWASQRGLPRSAGHTEGARVVSRTIYSCQARGIDTLTLYAFSTANWSRPEAEVETLMRLSAELAENETAEMVRRGIRVHVLGELDRLPERTRRALEQMVTATRACTGMTLALAISYGGRQDMVSAIRQIAIHAQAGLVAPEDIDERRVRDCLSTGDLSDPDLVIRTGGEHRLSDFLLFECAYTELVFCDTLWPDFSDGTLDTAIEAFSRRQRRFGKTGAQVVAASA